MSLTGKILAVLNIFGAFAFLMLFFMDYSKREAWAYANFTHDVAVNGLPLDDKQTDDQESPLKNKLSDKTLSEWFPGAPVSTQVQEVQAVQKAVNAKLAEAGGDPLKETVAYAGILTPFAHNNDEREWLLGLRTYLATPEDEARLKKRLGLAFAEAVRLYRTRPQAIRFEQAFADACRTVGGVPCPAVEQTFVQYLPAKPENTFEAAAKATQAVKPPDPATNPISPGQYDHAVALAFLASLRGDAQTTLRQPTDDPAKVKDTLDDVYQATLPPIHETAKTQLDELFDAALNGPKSLDPNKANDRLRDYQRVAIAHLLFNMVEILHPDEAEKGVTGSADYTRFVAVVGLKAAAHEVNEQAQVLQRVTQQLQGARDLERGDFAAAHRKGIDELQARAVMLHDANALLEQKTQQVEAATVTVGKRRDDVKAAEAELTDARTKTEADMAKLRQKSDSLHGLRMQSRDVLGENLELEKQIRGLEQKH